MTLLSYLLVLMRIYFLINECLILVIITHRRKLCNETNNDLHESISRKEYFRYLEIGIVRIANV